MIVQPVVDATRLVLVDVKWIKKHASPPRASYFSPEELIVIHAGRNVQFYCSFLLRPRALLYVLHLIHDQIVLRLKMLLAGNLV